MPIRRGFLLCCAAALSTAAALAQPFALHPENPHYFLFRGKPTVLVTSGEHYGAVINRDFNYVLYLDELRRHGLNNTRIWVGPYREIAGNFNITRNTLAPEPDRFMALWPRSSTPGAADGLNKFDLEKWNPEFFTRLKAFLREADKRDVVVEVNLFCPYYEESMWNVSPLNAKNNVNGVGDVPRTEALTMKHAGLVRVQETFVRRIVDELSAFDNLYYEICNEAYFGGVTLEWQEHIARVIYEQESRKGRRHLISQNIANGSKRVEKPFETVSIFNFHYSRPADSVGMNYDLKRAIGNNETGFDGTADATYRIQGWEFLMAGGALYNNLDYSFVVGHERGDFAYPANTPGGGSTALRAQLGALKKFFDALPFVRMVPLKEVTVRSAAQDSATVRGLGRAGEVYAVYVHHGRPVKGGKPQYQVDGREQKIELTLDVPAGTYRVSWLHPKSGKAEEGPALKHAGGALNVTSPAYTEDIALRLSGLGAGLRAPRGL
jgi:hypothetical protein